MGAPAEVDLRRHAGAVAIERDVLLVQGPEAVAFLQGQLSQDVEALAIGTSRPSLLLQPTGKVDAWLRATRLEDDTVLLDVEAGFGDLVHQRLRRFKLRTKAELEPATWRGWALRGPDRPAVEGGAGHHALEVTWPSAPGLDLLGPTAPEVDLPHASAGSLEALRIAAGIPAMGAEVTPETIPAELGQTLIDLSVSFTKGCYTGQELVARIDSRGGNVPRPVRGLQLRAAPPEVGAPVVADGKAVGVVTSSASSPAFGAIALAPVARSVEPGTTVQVGGADATVVELPFR